MRTLGWFVASMVIAGCGGTEDEGGADGADGANTTTSSSSAGDASASVGHSNTTAVDGTGGTSGLGHGAIELIFRRGESSIGDPYVGTARVIVTMDYETCLRDYYEANPDAQQDGSEGQLVFGRLADGGEGWQDRLCSGVEMGQAPCSILSIRQRFDSGTPFLSVEYEVQGSIENQVLLFGPLPTAATAGCSDPIVRVSPILPTGYDAQDTQIWIAETISPISSSAEQPGLTEVKAKPT